MQVLLGGLDFKEREDSETSIVLCYECYLGILKLDSKTSTFTAT